MRPRLNRSTWILGGVVLVVVLSTGWVRCNVSASAPYGLYRLTRLDARPRVGTWVVLPVPTIMRPWWKTFWIQLLKPVAAVAGDEICVEQGWLRVKGDWFGPVLTEARGKMLPHMDGCQIVPENEVFLASDMPRSMDGRYWGMTPIATLKATALPLFTWR